MGEIPFERSFASHEKSQYWSSKNNVLPKDVYKGSSKKYWFNCPCGHEFESMLSNISREKNNRWCPYCCNPPNKLCNKEDCKSCFEKSFASHEKSKYWSEKNKFKPREVFKNSGIKYLFNCDCGHEFESMLYNILKNQWCSYCSIPSRSLCNKIDCEQCFKKSFASHDKAKYWSNKNELKPRDVYKNANNKYLFECNNCNHIFESDLSKICNGRWCPYCSNPPQKLCNKEHCKSCFEKSFASHDKAKYWSEKNELKPREVFKNSYIKYLFNCDCNHEFESILSNISKGIWCPYCSEPGNKLCSNEDCKSCFEKSFASHKKAKYWSEKNELKPRDVFLSSGNKYFFICEKKHIFDCSLNCILRNIWCPLCVNKTEEKLFQVLIINYPNIKHQFKANWCKNPITNQYLPFDFVLQTEKIIIELDGTQHFKQVSNWRSPEEQYERDSYKMECANNNGYSVIRITQEDVYDDTFDWYKSLKDSIESIIQSKDIENHFISYHDDYSNFY
jgi:very-short-patch-repair endonuclease